MPINKMTSIKVSQLGWAAEARDRDGHLISCVGWLDSYSRNGNLKSLVDFIREYETNCTVTVFPENVNIDQP